MQFRFNSPFSQNSSTIRERFSTVSPRSTIDAYKKALKISGVLEQEVRQWKIIKYSVDARNKAQISKVYSIGLYVESYHKTRKNVLVIEKEKQYSYELSLFIGILFVLIDI